VQKIKKGMIEKRIKKIGMDVNFQICYNPEGNKCNITVGGQRNDKNRK